MTRRFAILCAVMSLAAAPLAAQKRKEIPVAKDVGPKEQDIKIGREVAAQVEQKMHVIPNRELTDYVNRIGRRLVNTGLLDRDFPYSFKVLQDPSLNAFALPGGPMFVHTGLIGAAETEAQLAGVLAHELAHVSLRHAVANASKQQTAQLLGSLGGAILGGVLGGGLGQIAGVGAQALGYGFAMKYSRGAESEADLLGSYVMAKAGYNPLELGRFFEKLEAEMGGNPGAVGQLMSSHPNPGNRTKAIEEQAPYMARGPFNAREGDLNRMRQVVQGLPAAPKGKQPSAGGTTPGGQPLPPMASPDGPVPAFEASRQFKTVSAGQFQFGHPDNWQALSDQQSNQLTIVPQGGLVDGGGLAAGIIVSVFQPQRAGSLTEGNQQLIQNLVETNQGQLRQQSEPQQAQINGYNALLTRFTGPSPYKGQRETVMLAAIGVGDKLLYLVFVAPESRWNQLEPVYQEVFRTVRIQGQR